MKTLRRPLTILRLERATLGDVAPDDHRDCVLTYATDDQEFKTLVSIDEHGNRYEEMRTSISRIHDVREFLLARVRERPAARPVLTVARGGLRS
jgi:hypothetical protein